MFELELSHTFSIVEWRCPVTRIVDLAFIKRAISRGSLTEFRCSILGCRHVAPAIAMLNIDRTKTSGVVVIVCHRHAREMESRGHRCFWLDRTLAHAVQGYEARLEATALQAIQHAASARVRTAFGQALAQACRKNLARVA